DTQADAGEEGIRIRAQPLDRLADAAGPPDADGRRLAKADLEAVLLGERGLTDLLLHLAVQRHRELLPCVVLTDVDQRVLLRELRERCSQRTSLRRVARLDDRLERRRCEVVLDGAMRFADRVADLDLGQPPELADLARRDRLPRDRRTVV